MFGFWLWLRYAVTSVPSVVKRFGWFLICCLLPIAYCLLDPGWLLHRPFVADVPGVERGLGFQQYQVHLFLGYRHVLHSARNNQELTGIDAHFAVAQAHEQLAFDHKEKLVLIVMMMPDEFAFQLDHLHIRVVQFA